MVVDIFMHEKGGLHVLMEINNVAPKPTIIAMSGGRAEGPARLEGGPPSNWGLNRVLLKPFDQRTVLVTLQEVLGGLP